jgi:FkbM family methyltransferase
MSEFKQAMTIVRSSGVGDLLRAVWYLKLLNRPQKYVSRLYCPELGHDVVMRRYTSDLFCLPHIVREREYRHLSGLNNPKIIVDLGANVGYTTLWLKQQYPDSMIIAVEPSRSNYELLIRNIELSGHSDIKAINAGIWNRDGYLVQINDEKSDMWTAQFDVTDSNSSDGVPVVTLNTIMDEYNISMIDILKVDIEGAERHLLTDTSFDWPAKVSVLAIETHDVPGYGDTRPLLDLVLDKYSHVISHFSQTLTIKFEM